MNHEDIQKILENMKNEIERQKSLMPKDKLSMIVFSGDLDKLLAAFIIATGAAAMDIEVCMFFTFWATPALRDPKKKPGLKDFMGKIFGFMLPKGVKEVKLSKMNMGGLGTKMMKNLMKKKNVKDLNELIKVAAELGVKIYICEMSMNLMGFGQDEMIDYPNLEYVGVATFLKEAGESKMQLFI